MIPTGAVLCGTAVGAGVALLVNELMCSAPALGPALQRLNNPGVQGSQAVDGDGEKRWGAWLVEHVAGLPGVHVPSRDLALLGQSPGRFLLMKVALAGAGLLLPPLATIPLVLLGLPVFIPPVVGLICAAVLWIGPDLAVRDSAKRAREEFSHAMAAYLDLVALKRAGNAAAEQAMEQAAKVGQGWAFLRIQEALARSRVDKVPHWESLARLTVELDLPVLDDIAAIMRQSSDDGASVYTTLRSRARNLRSELLVVQAAEANADSEKMTAPGALLAVLVMLLIAFPAVIRILTT